MTAAVIVVDVQHDFADPTGSLYVRGGEQIVGPINDLVTATLAAGGLVAYTQDWHPEHTPHFAIDGGLWPVHCVIDSPGAAFVPGLVVAGPVVRKGSGPEDGYSGFSVLDLTTGTTNATELAGLLNAQGVTEVTVVGLAGDWCVKATAIDAANLGYATTVPLTLTRFVELQPGDADRAVAEMKAAGVAVLD